MIFRENNREKKRGKERPGIKLATFVYFQLYYLLLCVSLH